MVTFFSILKDIKPFLYILGSLLLFNIFFNLNYDWYGISLIVRIYLFIFSFYLIFSFTSLNKNILKQEYINKFGNKGELILFLETRIMPFLLIYLITFIFTLIDYLRIPNWPWKPIISLLNGRYSNLIIYSLILLLILKLRKKPNITIPLLLFISILYFILDKTFYSLATTGTTISIIKISKLFIFFSFAFFEFFRKISKSLIYSILISCLTYFSTIGFYSAVYKYSDEISYQRKDSALQLLRCGYLFPLNELKKIATEKKDYDLFNKLLRYSKKYNFIIDYENRDWEKLLFSGSIKNADIISEYILDKNMDQLHIKIMFYSFDKSQEAGEHPENAKNFIKLASKHLNGHENDLIQKIHNSNKRFKLWGIAVLAEHRSIKSIPLLLELLSNMDINISKSAYTALKQITGIDPSAENNKKINDIHCILKFREYYFLHRNII
ncbi:MAG: hypothetical protein SVR08_04825 [Spirochaetota bacterium]|nr:hypothetical protein [Spirochaetota bacterium]